MTWFSAIKLVEYDPDSRMARHAHADASLSLVVEGRYREHVGGAEVDHKPGHMLFCPAHEEHEQAFAGGGARQALMTPTSECLAVLKNVLDVSAATFQADQRFSALGRRIAVELRRDDRVTQLAVEALALEAVTAFARSCAVHHSAPAWLARVHDYVRCHARHSFTIHDIARAAGCRAEDIGPALKAHYGVSVGALARRFRLEEAARMLAADELAIPAIAADCGFCDQAHLTRAFKSAYGLTPGAFRRSRALPVFRTKAG